MAYFRYGYDPWMIGLSLASLVPGIVGMAMGNAPNGPTSTAPFGLLTVYVVLLLVMFLTSCFILNDARNEVSLKSPLAVISLGLMAIYIVLALIPELLNLSTISFALGFLSVLSLAFMAVTRKNWISLIFEIFTAFTMVLVYVT